MMAHAVKPCIIVAGGTPRLQGRRSVKRSTAIYVAVPDIKQIADAIALTAWRLSVANIPLAGRKRP